mmetsp:Transcript_1873/g.5641  ORF Transcript_1873/g.5641 Transcript_1873/m.5641 type:complete len:293 (+) Transcript_1873:1390-2268(+)
MTPRSADSLAAAASTSRGCRSTYSSSAQRKDASTSAPRRTTRSTCRRTLAITWRSTPSAGTRLMRVSFSRAPLTGRSGCGITRGRRASSRSSSGIRSATWHGRPGRRPPSRRAPPTARCTCSHADHLRAPRRLSAGLLIGTLRCREFARPLPIARAGTLTPTSPQVHVYDLSENKSEPICEQKVVRKAKLTKLAFNLQGAGCPVLVVGDDHSSVSSLKLSPNLRWTAITKAEAEAKAKAEADAAAAGGGPRRGAVPKKVAPGEEVEQKDPQLQEVEKLDALVDMAIKAQVVE